MFIAGVLDGDEADDQERVKIGDASRFRPKTGTRGQELCKDSGVGLAIGLAMALRTSFAKYRYELTAFCLMAVNLFYYLLSLLLSSYS